ncbi:MAG: GDP-mannose 4,6-dehydratase [Bacteroidia bacterium]
MKHALIIGHTGQDGTYLFSLLENLGYAVTGISSKEVKSPISLNSKIDILNEREVTELIREIQPCEIYYLAAVHQSATEQHTNESELFKSSFNINVFGLLNVLNAVAKHSSASKIFYAASSHVFGDNSDNFQTEETPFKPVCVYGISKSTAIQSIDYFINQHKIYCSVGYLYNHESPLRAEKFVSKKIVKTAIAISNDSSIKLFLGDLSAKIDWGYAPDYVNAMHKILQLDNPDKFIISSGVQHTVKDFVEEVFALLGLNWEDYVQEIPGLLIKKQKRNLKGDSSKLKKLTGWQPSVDFKEMIHILVDSELSKHGK